jgi:maltose O-acetyltransferase
VKTEKEKMLAGELYLASDKELVQARNRARRLSRAYNATNETEDSKRKEILKELWGSCKENIFIEPNIRVDYGSNIPVGGENNAHQQSVQISSLPNQRTGNLHC